MTTPTEDEARAALTYYESGIVDGSLTGSGPLKFPAPDPVERDAGRRLASALRDLLASRVSTPPSEPHPVKPASESGRVDTKVYCETCRGSVFLHETGTWLHVLGDSPATPPTDEDEREALDYAIRVPLSEARIGYKPFWRLVRAIQDSVWAAGFRRQAVSTPEPEWEFGLTWEPSVTGSDEPANYAGCETEAGTWETGRRLAGAQTPRVWKRPMRPAVQSVPAGPWEPVPTTEGEA